MNEEIQQLSLEQEFQIRSFKDWVENKASAEEIKQRLMDIYIHSIHKENRYKAQIHKSWGIGNPQ